MKTIVGLMNKKSTRNVPIHNRLRSAEIPMKNVAVGFTEVHRSFQLP